VKQEHAHQADGQHTSFRLIATVIRNQQSSDANYGV
jgi:hypothetical protein